MSFPQEPQEPQTAPTPSAGMSPNLTPETPGAGSRNGEFLGQVHRITAGSPSFGQEAGGASEMTGV